MTKNVLFICSKNQWRSPTAEKVFSKHGLVSCRARGTSRSARVQVSSKDLAWADIVFVMEQKHKQRLCADYPGETKYKEIHVFDIPDEYRFMDPDLVELFEDIIPHFLGGEDN